MGEPLDELYLTWLYKEVGSVRNKNPVHDYWDLFRQLYKKEFVWIVPNDDNRVEDGRELRREFFEEAQIDDADRDWIDLGCSVLEMLMGLSRRLAFEGGGQPRRWFWMFIENMGLATHTLGYHNYAEVEAACDRLIWRQYEPNGGGGGLFPLHYPDRDQRDVEIWYQLNAYLLENS